MGCFISRSQPVNAMLPATSIPTYRGGDTGDTGNRRGTVEIAHAMVNGKTQKEIDELHREHAPLAHQLANQDQDDQLRFGDVRGGEEVGVLEKTIEVLRQQNPGRRDEEYRESAIAWIAQQQQQQPA